MLGVDTGEFPILLHTKVANPGITGEATLDWEQWEDHRALEDAYLALAGVETRRQATPRLAERGRYIRARYEASRYLDHRLTQRLDPSMRIACIFVDSHDHLIVPEELIARGREQVLYVQHMVYGTEHDPHGSMECSAGVSRSSRYGQRRRSFQRDTVRRSDGLAVASALGVKP